jgi:hypothetical protein
MNKRNYDEIISLLKQEIKTGPYAHITFEEKFWKQIQFPSNYNDCWIFNGKLYSNGYGCFGINRTSFLAHRISFLIYYHYLPNNENIVMHNCDNRACVNPLHLKEGSTSDNIQDMLNKNRNNPSKGENHFRCKLSDQDVLDIRKARKKGVLGKVLAEKYHVSKTQIYRIANNKRRRGIIDEC